jgi:hypothetical protein
MASFPVSGYPASSGCKNLMREGAAFTFHGGGGGHAQHFPFTRPHFYEERNHVFLFSKGKETDIFGQIKVVHFSPGERWEA